MVAWSWIFLGLFALLVYSHLAAEYVPGTHIDLYWLDYFDYLSGPNLQAACASHRPFLFRLDAVLNPAIYSDLGIDRTADRAADNGTDRAEDRHVVYSLPPTDSRAILETYFAPLTPCMARQAVWYRPHPAPVRAHFGSRLFLLTLEGPVCVRLARWRDVVPPATRPTNCLGIATTADPSFWADPAYTYTEVVLWPGAFLYVPPYTWFGVVAAPDRPGWTGINSAPPIVCEFGYQTLMNQVAHSLFPVSVPTQWVRPVTPVDAPTGDASTGDASVGTKNETPDTRSEQTLATTDFHEHPITVRETTDTGEDSKVVGCGM